MFRGFEGSHGGIVLYQTPSRRQRIMRRRWTALGAIAAMAAAGWIIGALAWPDQGGPMAPVAGPFSYFPQ